MGKGDPIDSAKHVAAVEAYSGQNPELYVQDDEAKAEYNGDAWDTNPDLLWTQDNEAFYKLVGAKEGGGKDRAIDTSLDDWLAQAHATNSFVQRSGLFLLNHNRKREFVPLVPKHILAAAVAGDSDVRFATTHAFGPVNHLAMSLMMLYSGLFNKASVYQLIIEKSQLKLFEEVNRYDTQAVAEAYVLRHAVDQIIEWRTKATRGLLRPSSNIWQYTLLNDVTDQVTVHQFRISPFFHPNSKLNQKLTKDQISTQINTATRHWDHSRHSSQLKTQKKALQHTRDDVDEHQEQLRRIRQDMAGNNVRMREMEKALQKLREKQGAPATPADDGGVSKALTTALSTSNSRQEMVQRQNLGLTFYSILRDDGEKLFKDHGLLDSKGKLVLSEGEASIKAFKLFKVAFLDRNEASITNVATEKDIGDDVYIKLISKFLQPGLSRWAATRQKDRPPFNEDREPYRHKEERDTIGDWLKALGEQLNIEPQSVVNERDMFKLDIFDYIERAKSNQNNGFMPTLDQVKAEVHSVCGEFSGVLQATALRRALGPWAEYVAYRRDNINNVAKLNGATDTVLEWKAFHKFLKKKHGYEQGTLTTFSKEKVAQASRRHSAPASTTDASVAAMHGATKPDSSLNMPVTDATCGKCGVSTRSHETKDCLVEDDEALAGRQLHAKLTRSDKFYSKMDLARKLELRPSESGAFNPGLQYCKICEGLGIKEQDHWQIDCPHREKQRADRKTKPKQPKRDREVSFGALSGGKSSKKRNRGGSNGQMLSVSKADLLALTTASPEQRRRMAKKIKKASKSSKKKKKTGRINMGNDSDADHDDDTGSD